MGHLFKVSGVKLSLPSHQICSTKSVMNVLDATILYRGHLLEVTGVTCRSKPESSTLQLVNEVSDERLLSPFQGQNRVSLHTMLEGVIIVYERNKLVNPSHDDRDSALVYTGHVSRISKIREANINLQQF